MAEPSGAPTKKVRHGFVGWMADNHVAANLLMLALVLGGIYSMMSVPKEIFPTFAPNSVAVSVSYPGASPEEVEEGIVLPIEAELRSISDITEINSSASEGYGQVTAELVEGASIDRAVQDIRSAVDRITSFPDDIEPPRVRYNQWTRSVVELGITGDISEQAMYDLTQRVRDELLMIEGVSGVNISGLREPEISIEISQRQLRALGLTLTDVASIVRSSARDVPAGGFETNEGEYLLRTEGRKERGLEFAEIPLKSDDDGSVVRLKDVANINDGFTEAWRFYRFNGQPGVRLFVTQAEGGNPVDLATRVKEYLEGVNATLPEAVSIQVTDDDSENYSDRAKLLIGNGVGGLLLVIITLGLFLNLRLAFWVSVSIPVVMIGSFVLLWPTGQSLNILTMMTFILTLGIVVDDAIIVGENIYAKAQQGLSTHDAVLEGAKEMVVPVTFAVLTNIIAFIPLMFIPGETGQFMKALPIVACTIFVVSLVESLLVLPSHLNGKGSLAGGNQAQSSNMTLRRVGLFRQRVARTMDNLRDTHYRNGLVWALKHPASIIVGFLGFVAVIFVWYSTDRIELGWSPRIASDRVDGELEMPTDATFDETLEVALRLEAAGLRALDQLGGRDQIESWEVSSGWGGYTQADVTFQLKPEKERSFTQAEFTNLWRQEMGEVPEAKMLQFEFVSGPGAGKALRFALSHPNEDTLEAAARELAAGMENFAGVFDVADGTAEGKRQLRFSLTPEGRALGLTEASLGRQIRATGYGAEALRMLRDGSEVRVFARLPREERQSVNNLSEFVVFAPDGTEIPLLQAAEVENTRAFTDIRRENGQRVIRVTGGVNESITSITLARQGIVDGPLQDILAKYPGLSADVDQGFGGRGDRTRVFGAIFAGVGGMLIIIYAMMAALFRNYVQGFIVVLTIPFSASAGIAGHILMGYDMAATSIFGMIALGGLVVNGSLVLTTRFNEALKKGMPLQEAIIEAAISRFRPIVLTSITTTVGLMPLLFETSGSARWLVPMAIALSFGTVFSTFVTLFLIPVLHELHQKVSNALANNVGLGEPVEEIDPDKLLAE